MIHARRSIWPGGLRALAVAVTALVCCFLVVGAVSVEDASLADLTQLGSSDGDVDADGEIECDSLVPPPRALPDTTRAVCHHMIQPHGTAQRPPPAPEPPPPRSMTRSARG